MIAVAEEIASNVELGSPPCTPDKRRKKGIPPGVDVVLSDGLTWQLPYPGLNSVLRDVRDRVFNEVTWARRASVQDALFIAWILLLEGYDLTREEAATLVVLPNDRVQQLVDAVIDALFGPNTTDGTVEYSDWAYGAMLANGIDPRMVPPHLQQVVLAHLVGSGRAVPENRMIGSAIASRKRSKIDAPRR